jgi:hypothetical protein
VPFVPKKKPTESWEMRLWNGGTDSSSGSAVPFCACEKPSLFLQVVEKIWRPDGI